MGRILCSFHGFILKSKIIIWTVILVFLLCGIYAYTHRSRVSVGKTSAHPLVKVEKWRERT